MTSANERRTRSGKQSSYHSPQDLTGDHFYTLPLTVLFTTASGTLDALRKASQLADQLGARLRVLAAYVVPYPLPIDKPRVSPAFRLRPFLALCDEELIEIALDIRLCRDAGQCIQDALAPHSLVLIGEREGWWRQTFEKRLARDLRTRGHHVVFVRRDRQS